MRGSNLWLLVIPGLLACERSPFREVKVTVEQPATTSVHVAAPKAGTAKPFRVSVAGMESPSGTYEPWSQLFDEVGRRLHTDVEFVQRRTYAEVNQLLLSGDLDAALLCTGGYLELQRRDPEAVEVIAVPIINDSDTYQSLIIVPTASAAKSLDDLEGSRFAFTDELSLTGRAWVVHQLRKTGRDPERFFGSTTFTRSHDRSVSAVARGLVDAAAVHSIVFQHLITKEPQLLTQVRVIGRSPAFGMTPLVASRRLSPGTRAGLRETLLALDGDPQGAAVLRSLQIGRFSLASAGLFDSAQDVVQSAP